MNYFAIGLLIVLAGFFGGAMIERICTCVERCSAARACGKLNMKSKEMEEMLNGWKCADDGK